MNKLCLALLLTAMSHTCAAAQGSIAFTGSILAAPCSIGTQSVICTGGSYSVTLSGDLLKLTLSLPKFVGTASIDSRSHTRIIKITYL